MAGVRARAMAPTTQRTIIGGRSDCAVTNRDGAGRAAADPIAALAGTGRASIDEKSALAERVPWPAARIAMQRTG